MIKLLFALIAIAGYIANIKGYKKESYLLWSASNLYWMIYNDMHGEKEMACMFAVYGLFCVWGMFKELYKNENYLL